MGIFASFYSKKISQSLDFVFFFEKNKRNILDSDEDLDSNQDSGSKSKK